MTDHLTPLQTTILADIADRQPGAAFARRYISASTPKDAVRHAMSELQRGGLLHHLNVISSEPGYGITKNGREALQRYNTRPTEDTRVAAPAIQSPARDSARVAAIALGADPSSGDPENGPRIAANVHPEAQGVSEDPVQAALEQLVRTNDYYSTDLERALAWQQARDALGWTYNRRRRTSGEYNPPPTRSGHASS